MERTLEQFSAELHRILAADPGPRGARRSARWCRRCASTRRLSASTCPTTRPERNILYEDKELGFCILGHVYHGAKESKPHDHGPTWAIYGQAVGETIMSDWEMLSPPGNGEPGKVQLVRDYKLTPGTAYVYNEGDLHSPRRDGSTRLIRIEGQQCRERSKRAARSAETARLALIRQGQYCRSARREPALRHRRNCEGARCGRPLFLCVIRGAPIARRRVQPSTHRNPTVARLAHAIRGRHGVVVLAAAGNRHRPPGHAHTGEDVSNVTRPEDRQPLIIARRTRAVGVPGHLHGHDPAGPEHVRGLLQDGHPGGPTQDRFQPK